MSKEDLKRLKVEDMLIIISILASIGNLYGNVNEKKYLQSMNVKYKKNANELFEIGLIITFLIYIYYLIRNIISFNNIEEEKKDIYLIKVIGTIFLIVGVVLLYYFQIKQESFVGAPAV